MLKCPVCGKEELFRKKLNEKSFLVVFKCLFAAIVPNKSDEEIQEILDEAKRSGMIDKWLRGELPTTWIEIRSFEEEDIGDAA